MTAVGRWLLALAGGALWGVCFAPRPLVVAPWLALAPLMLLLGQRRAIGLGFLHGLVFWLVSIPWIADTLVTYGQLAPWLARLSLLGLAAYLALFQAAFAAVGSRLWRSGGLAALVGVPALWVSVEWLRGHLLTGFPWNLSAYAWIAVPGALPMAAWIGAWGVGFLVALSGTAVAMAVARRRWQVAAGVAGAILVFLALAARWAGGSGSSSSPSGGLSVRVLQPNIGVVTEWDPARIAEGYGKILELSRAACDEPGALLIWPESAAWPFSYSEDERLRRDLEILADRGCPVLMNTSTPSGAGTYNSVLLVDREGIAGRYDKRHLVPFGEYVPMARWLPFLKKIARRAGEFLTGEEGSLLAWGGERLGTAICFEVIFPEEVMQQVRRGATALVTVTNDAWYGDSWAPWQHFRAARFRAAESRRFLLRAAITGVSAIVGPDGSVEQQLGVGEAGILGDRVVGRSELSPFAARPWLVPGLCLGLLAFAILVRRRENQR